MPGTGARDIAATVSRADGEPEDALANNRSSQTTIVLAAPADLTSSPAPTLVLSDTPPVSPNPITATPAAAAAPAGLPFTGIDATTGITLASAMVLLGGLLVRTGRRRPASRAV